MTRVLFLAVIAVFLTATAAGAQVVLKDNPRHTINGAQVFVMDAAYKNNVGAFFKEAKAKGVDTVFFRVFHNSGDRPHFGMAPQCKWGVYFKTDVLCTVNDVLGQVVKAAHLHGIKIYAWMATRSLTDLKTEGNLSLAFSPAGGVEAGYGANIFNKTVRSNLIELFKDLAAYDIDGILFQDDFIFKYTEGADKESAELFYKETGIEAKAETFFKGTKEYNGRKVFSGFKDEFYIWANWKAYHMSKLFARLRQEAKSVNPSLSFAANIYYETPLYPEQGLAWYSQRMAYLDEAGADYFAVMGYHEQIGRELNKNSAQAAEFVGNIAKSAAKEAKEPARVVMKLQTSSFFKSGEAVKINEFNQVCRNVRRTSGVSVAVVPVFTSANIYDSCFTK
ncbi:MAG: family 10 glycosylhydrolase [Deferribacterales bacterium]|nr:family 10 glycosylhydrolase [Deferribacterales bacterium]